MLGDPSGQDRVEYKSHDDVLGKPFLSTVIGGVVEINFMFLLCDLPSD